MQRLREARGAGCGVRAGGVSSGSNSRGCSHSGLRPVFAQQTENSAVVQLAIVLEDSPAQGSIECEAEAMGQLERPFVCRAGPDLDSVEVHLRESEGENLADSLLREPVAPLVLRQVVPKLRASMIRIPVEQGHAANDPTQLTNQQSPGDLSAARVLFLLLGDEAQRLVSRLMRRRIVELDNRVAPHGKDIVGELGVEFDQVEPSRTQCRKCSKVEDGRPRFLNRRALRSPR